MVRTVIWVKGLFADMKQQNRTHFEDIMYIMAKNVEDALIQGGAKAGKDYTILDCYKLVQPFALEVFKKTKTHILLRHGRPMTNLYAAHHTSASKWLRLRCST